MNERIKELWDQAVERHGGGANGVAYFAELIVLKCAEIADIAEPFLASDLIKQQFGVEK